MGVFEMPVFAKGTLEIAKAVAAATAVGATSIVGGGDSSPRFINPASPEKSRTSRPAGASLEFLGGRNSPASKLSQANK